MVVVLGCGTDDGGGGRERLRSWSRRGRRRRRNERGRLHGYGWDERGHLERWFGRCDGRRSRSGLSLVLAKSTSAQCGVDCPETCDGYANNYEVACAALGVDYFTCLSSEPTSDYDREAGIIQRITGGL